MNKRKYIKENNINPISLILTSALDNGKIGIKYQSLKKGSYVLIFKNEYFKEDICLYPDEKKWNLKNYDFVKKDNPFYDISFYSCYVELDLNQAKGMIFEYQIFCGKYASDIRSFATQNDLKKWSYYSFVDFQHGFNDVTHKLINNLKQKEKCNLMLCSGDLTGTSANYFEWQWLFDNNDCFRDVLFNSAIGDHEYWAKYEEHASMFNEPIPYLNIMPSPDNGPELEKNKTFYFIFNNCLFIFLNTQDSDTIDNENIQNQLKWFRDIVNQNKGLYDYLIVYMHKSIYGSFENDTRVRKMMRPMFYPLFDECMVDVVFSGHDHRYCRTYALKDDKLDDNGTYYIDLGSSGNKRRTYEEAVDNDSLSARVVKIKEDELAIGALVNIYEDKIIVDIYDQNMNMVDNLEIKKKERK